MSSKRVGGASPKGRSSIEFGVETPEYLTQTKSDYAWPVRTHPDHARAVTSKLGSGTSIVLGHDSDQYVSTTHASYRTPVGFVKSESVVPPSNHTSILLGVDAPIPQSTTHAEYPPRELPPRGGNRQAKTDDLNRAHFVLGHDAPKYESTTNADARAFLESRACGPSAAELRLEETMRARLTDAAGKPIPAAEAGRKTHIVFGTETLDYTTSAAMPAHTGAKREKPFDPTTTAGSCCLLRAMRNARVMPVLLVCT